MPEHFYYNANLNGVALVDLEDKDTFTTDQLSYHYRLECFTDLDAIFGQIEMKIDGNTNTVQATGASYLDMAQNSAAPWVAIAAATSVYDRESNAASPTDAATLWRQALCRLIESIETDGTGVDLNTEVNIHSAETSGILGAHAEQSSRSVFSTVVNGAVASGTDITLVDASALAVGDRVYGNNIVASPTTTISSITGNVVTLSAAVSGAIVDGAHLYFERPNEVDPAVDTSTGALATGGNQTSTWQQVVDSVRYSDSRQGASATSPGGNNGARGDIAISQTYAQAFVEQAWRSGRIDATADADTVSDNFAFVGDGGSDQTLCDRLSVTFKILCQAASTQSYANTFSEGNILKFHSNPTAATVAASTLHIRVELMHNGNNPDADNESASGGTNYTDGTNQGQPGASSTEGGTGDQTTA